MKTLTALLLLVTLPVLAQVSFTGAKLSGFSVGPPPASGGGGSVSGPPGVLNTATNDVASGQTASVTVPSNSAANVMDIAWVQWFHSPAASVTSITNQSGTAGTLLTNVQFTTGAVNGQEGSVYYWTNPPATQHTITALLSQSASEIILSSITLTNCATTFGSVVFGEMTNLVNPTTFWISNNVASATNELVCGFIDYGINTGTPAPTIGSGMTLRAWSTCGAATEEGVITTQIGATTSTNKIQWATDNGLYFGVWVGVKGFP